jgi:hypothetical protein
MVVPVPVMSPIVMEMGAAKTVTPLGAARATNANNPRKK